MLENEICGYEGEFADLISQAPAFYKLMTRLLDDPDLPKPLSPHIIAAIAYFILPEDIIPEDKFGPVGYVDDIYLCAFVAKGESWRQQDPLTSYPGTGMERGR